jgi:DNA-binding winged helix-turn-helix (wHTH) protein
MKIVINTENNELFNTFSHVGKDSDHIIINAKVETVLFDNIEKNNVDAYVLSIFTPFFKKAVEFIKKNNPYIPIIGIIPHGVIAPNIPVDIYVTQTELHDVLVATIMYNINTYVKTFAILKKLTAKMHDKIEFASCVYDPTRRILYHKGKEIKKLSAKEGGILEILASNYGQVVKKEVILEKVWRKSDYFAGRSMDVYITYLRNTLKNNKIKLSIKNISGIGLILE